MRRLAWRATAGALALSAAAVSPSLPVAHSDPEADLVGDWSVSGRNSSGNYTGKVKIDKRDQSYIALINLDYSSGVKGTARFIGKLNGNVLKGDRVRTTGITDVLGDINRPPTPATYTLSPNGLRLVGRYGTTARETFTRTVLPPSGKATLLVDSNRDGLANASDRTAAQDGKSALVTLVPNLPGQVFGPLSVNVTQGKVKLQVVPAGALRFQGSTSTTELGVGQHELKIEAAVEGEAEVQLLSGTNVIDRAKVTVEKEKAYLILFGYMGAEVNYLEGDMNRCKQNILPKLKSAGFSVIEDGKSYDQSVIDKALLDPRASKKAILDWCVTGDDLTRYLSRGGTKGYAWSSHGFMEPFPGCPDNELTTFESRVWSSASGNPASNERKHFVREWRGHFEKNAKMDFALQHSCATGGLGADYSEKPWEYCTPATRDRAQAFLGTLPGVEGLKFTTFDSLAGFTTFNQTYDGSAYFGMWDVNWSQLTGSIKP